MFLKTPKFGMQQKARIFFSELPNLNLFHILTQDTESNHLKQKTKNCFFFLFFFFLFFFFVLFLFFFVVFFLGGGGGGGGGTKTLFLTKNNDF